MLLVLKRIVVTIRHNFKTGLSHSIKRNLFYEKVVEKIARHLKTVTPHTNSTM